MIKKLLQTFFIMFIVVLGYPTFVYAGPFLSTNWRSLSLDHSTCLKRGESALKTMGYSPYFSATSVWGENDEEILTIRCDNPNLIIFAAAYHTKPSAPNDKIDRLRGIF